MNWLDGLRSNKAELTADHPDPNLRPVVVALPPVHAVTWACHVIDGLPRWSIQSVYDHNGMIHARFTTPLFRFVDDIHIGFESIAAGSRIVARSQSRLGKIDFGQNARNLKMLTRALRRAERERTEQIKAAAAKSGSGA